MNCSWTIRAAIRSGLNTAGLTAFSCLLLTHCSLMLAQASSNKLQPISSAVAFQKGCLLEDNQVLWLTGKVLCMHILLYCPKTVPVEWCVIMLFAPGQYNNQINKTICCNLKKPYKFRHFTTIYSDSGCASSPGMNFKLLSTLSFAQTSPLVVLEVRHPVHHEIHPVWASLVPKCQADVVRGQAHDGGS